MKKWGLVMRVHFALVMQITDLPRGIKALRHKVWGLGFTRYRAPRHADVVPLPIVNAGLSFDDFSLYHTSQHTPYSKDLRIRGLQGLQSWVLVGKENGCRVVGAGMRNEAADYSGWKVQTPSGA